jgi:hypothetical protein
MARQRLTDKGIRGLEAPASGQIDYWDEIMPGFGVRVGHGGRKAFIVGTRINGKFKRITLKPAFPTLRQSRVRTLKRSYAKRRGPHPLPAIGCAH